MNLLTNSFKGIIKIIVRLIYPPRCIICQNLCGIDKPDGYICPECEQKLTYIDNIPIRFGNIMYKNIDIYFDMGYACFEYITVEKLIKAFKFSSIKPNGEYIAKMMYDFAVQNDIFAETDIITSVPISKRRFVKRGFNQTEVMAQYFSKFCKIEYKNILKRHKNTIAQYKLKSFDERIRNIKNAFSVCDNVNGKSILIIEDIFTTGATLNECAKVLKENGAKRVDFLSFSVSPHNIKGADKNV